MSITNVEIQLNGKQKRAVVVGHRRALPLGRTLKPSVLSLPLSNSLSPIDNLRRSKTVYGNLMQPLFGCSYSLTVYPCSVAVVQSSTF